MNSLFCFGLGYSAEALSRRLKAEGWHIAGTSRSVEGAAHAVTRGYVSFLFDGLRPADGIAAELANATHVLVSAGPDDDGDAVLRHHQYDIARSAAVKWIGYLSTIGVYGDTGGAWIDETATPRPGSERTKRRVEAEEAWDAFARQTGRKLEIFRLGGIYGPGRSAIEDLRAGTSRRIVKPGQVFNRIHVGDIANVLYAALPGKSPHTIYNVTDDEPAPPQDVIAYAAGLLGIDPPPEIPFETAAMSPMARSFYSENRRVRNGRLHEALGVKLAFPSYREGLKNILHYSPN